MRQDSGLLLLPPQFGIVHCDRDLSLKQLASRVDIAVVGLDQRRRDLRADDAVPLGVTPDGAVGDLLAAGSGHQGGLGCRRVADGQLVGDQVIGYHRRGYGRSTPARGPGSITSDALDCHQLLDGLGIDRAQVIGVSYGAAVALELAAMIPDCVHSLCVIEPPPRDVPSAPTFLAVVLKSAIQPALAWTLARYVFHLDDFNTFVVTACAILPTGQNVVLYAVRYRVGQSLAQTTAVITSALAVPLLLGAAWLLN